MEGKQDIQQEKNANEERSLGSQEPLMIVGGGKKLLKEGPNSPASVRSSRTNSKILFNDVSKHQFSETFKELGIYLLFVFLYCAVIFMPRNSVPYQQQKAVLDNFIYTEFEDGLDFTGITSPTQWYNWMDTVLVPNLFPAQWYNGDPLETKEEKLMTSFGAYRFGVARVRFQRVQSGFCEPYAPLSHIAPSCYPALTELTRETGVWNGLEFQSSDQTKSTEYSNYGTSKSYDGSGYVINLPANITEAQELVAQLQLNNSLDAATRLAMVEFNLYNPHVDFFIVGKFALEWLPSGFIQTSQLVRPVNLFNVYRVLTNNPTSHWENFNFALEIIFYFLVVIFIIIAVKEIHVMTFKVWVSDTENTIEFTYLVLILVQMILRFNLWSKIGNIQGNLLTKNTETFALVDQITWLVQQMDNITAVNAILFFSKILTYLRANKTLRLFAKALILAFTKMWSLLPIIMIVGSGFAVAFQIVFGKDVSNYMTWSRSLFSMFQALVGDFDLQQLRYSNYYLGPLLFGIFIVFNFFVILSMFLSIVDSALDEVRNQHLVQQEEFDPSDLLWKDFEYLFSKCYGGLMIVIRKCCGKRHQATKVVPTVENEVGLKSPDKAEGVDGFEEEKEVDNMNDWKKLYLEVQTNVQRLHEKQDYLLGLLDSTKSIMDQAREY